MSTENTGPYDVESRHVEDGKMLMRVRAVYPERAQAIADNLINQRLPESPRTVVVEVFPADGSDVAAARVVWQRPHDIRGADVPSPSDATGPADHVGRGSDVVGTKHP
jgi:hypothetical protein